MNENYESPATAFLAVRPGEMLHFSEERYDQESGYAVMLIETPAFPGQAHPESSHRSVLCAGWYTTEEGVLGDTPAWGWVHLEANTKELIGHGLESIRAIPGQWYYLLLSGGLGNRPQDHFKTSTP